MQKRTNLEQFAENLKIFGMLSDNRRKRTRQGFVFLGSFPAYAGSLMDVWGLVAAEQFDPNIESLRCVKLEHYYLYPDGRLSSS